MACYEKLSDWKARIQRRFPSADPKTWETVDLALSHMSLTEMQDAASVAAHPKDVGVLVESQGHQQLGAFGANIDDREAGNIPGMTPWRQTAQERLAEIASHRSPLHFLHSAEPEEEMKVSASLSVLWLRK